MHSHPWVGRSELVCALLMMLARILVAPSLTAAEEAEVPTTAAAAPNLRQEMESLKRTVEEQSKMLAEQRRLLEDYSQALQQVRRLVEQQSEELRATRQAANESRATAEQVQVVAQTNLRMAKLDEDAKASVLAGWTGSHPYIRSKDGNYRVEFGGQLQLDYRGYSGTATPPSTFAIRRARLEMAGILFKHYEYKVQGDFADGSSTLLRDGFVNVNYHKAAQFQFGHFKAPFSQEELQSSKHLDFVERSSVSALAPSRTPGMMFQGKLLNGTFEYYAGAFNGRKDLLLNTASTPEGYVRLRFTPVRGFSFGGAFADGRHRNDSSFAGRTASRSFTFFSATPVNGEIVRANGEFWWNYRNFSLRGEYDQTHQSRQGLGPGGTNLPGVIGKGLVVQTTYLLTGEEKSENGITPKVNFLDGRGGRGAWELAFRYENLQMHDSAKPNRAEAFTFGVNWWLTKFVRYQSNFILEQFKDPLRAPTPGDTDHFGYLSRIQVIF